MKKISELKRTHVILFALLVLVAHDLLATILASVFNHFLPLNRSTNLFFMVIEIIVLIISILMVDKPAKK